MSDQYHLEAEQAVLGSLLLDRSSETGDIITERLYPEAFSPEHRVIFETVCELHDSGKPIDLITLSTALKDQGVLEDVGGISYLSDLAKAVPTIANLPHYVSILESNGLKQKTRKALEEQQKALETEDDPRKVIASMQLDAEALNGQIRSERTLVSIHKVMNDHEDELEARAEAKGLSGIPTCGSDLNKLTGGRQKQDLIIVAARPSVGKTAFMLNGALSAAQHGSAVAIFSLEMPAIKLGERLVANIGMLDGTILRTGHLSPDDWPKYTCARSILSTLPIYIDDTPGITIQEIASKVKQLKKIHKDLLIQVDYLQLINPGRKFQSREQEISYISRSLKQIARDNDCPVEALAQLSRSVEQRQDKRPMMSDLRESGSIEQDADEIDFLYRDDYYNADTEKKNIVEIIVAKGRNTGTGLVEMVYLKNFSRFCDYERYQY
ncbi:replicative DNA helicase [Paenibacillus antarcticus]|uniref:Replicative DNA helicase n=1 Tax=Paenibacillus antarcticus TaxID=253703 RepID=A0A168PAE9_9BACL|nr:replicative DNA helicase [Paenibacillus antarcticus]OAB46564.1 hypothetical protein PBAT_11145 [Paenibacillus antarcticus]